MTGDILMNVLPVETAHKSLIKPIAFKPITSAVNQPRYGPSYSPQQPQPQPRPSPHGPDTSQGIKPYNNHAEVGKSPAYNNNNHDDGYISQEYHSHSNSNSSSLQKVNVGGGGGGGQGQTPTSTSNLHQFTPPLSQRIMSPHMENNNKFVSGQGQQGQGQQTPESATPKVTYLTDSGQKMVSSHPLGGIDSRESRESFNSSRVSRDSSSGSLQHHPSGSGPGSVSSANNNTAQPPLDCSFLQTPSPSDSGLGELEAILRERDVQIRQLRETMERNETAILQVCEEKEQNWEMRFRELQSDWEKKLRLQQQKAFKMEQALLMQLFKLQQEKKTTRLEIEALRTEKERADRCASNLESEVKTSKTKLEEMQWDMCQKVGEISHLKSQLKEAKDTQVQKNSDLLSIRAQLKEAQRDNGEKNGEILGLESELKKSQDAVKDMRKELDDMQAQFSKYKSSPGAQRAQGVQEHEVTSSSSSENSPKEVKSLQEEIVRIKAEYETDKDRWLAEKDKVIRYQRHLQLNYVQMANKNKILEAEVQQLTLELEGRDICLESAKVEGEGEESIC